MADLFSLNALALDDSAFFRLWNARARSAECAILAEIPGEWEPATVSGRLLQQGWGAAVGYPGLILDEHGGEVEGFVFSSHVLAEHWNRLDEFEGAGYERVLTSVNLRDGTTVEAYVYTLSGNDGRLMATNDI